MLEVEELEHRVGVGVTLRQRRQPESTFDEPQDRSVVVDPVRHEVSLRERGYDHGWDPDAVAIERCVYITRAQHGRDIVRHRSLGGVT
jgi:hypothetical protein